jgi:hypothetical protein
VKTITLKRDSDIDNDDDNNGKADDSYHQYQDSKPMKAIRGSGSFLSSDGRFKKRNQGRNTHANGFNDAHDHDNDDHGNRNGDDEHERGVGVNQDIWAFKKGNLRQSSELPYEGDLSGDEDGDFN